MNTDFEIALEEYKRTKLKFDAAEKMLEQAVSPLRQQCLESKSETMLLALMSKLPRGSIAQLILSGDLEALMFDKYVGDIVF